MKALIGFICLALLLSAPMALAQSTATPVVTGYLTTVGCPAGQTTCFVQYGAGGSSVPISTSPPKLTAYGSIAVTSSVSITNANITLGNNSPAWVTTLPSNYIAIRNSIASAGMLYACWCGGTCSATAGEPIAVGESVFRYPSGACAGAAPTLFSTNGASAWVEE